MEPSSVLINGHIAAYRVLTSCSLTSFRKAISVKSDPISVRSFSLYLENREGISLKFQAQCCVVVRVAGLLRRALHSDQINKQPR